MLILKNREICLKLHFVLQLIIFISKQNTDRPSTDKYYCSYTHGHEVRIELKILKVRQLQYFNVSSLMMFFKNVTSLRSLKSNSYGL